MDDNNIDEELIIWFQKFNELSEYNKLKEIIRIHDKNKLIYLFLNDDSNHIKLAAYSKIKDTNVLDEFIEVNFRSEDRNISRFVLLLRQLHHGKELEFDYLKKWINLNKWSEELVNYLKNLVNVVNNFELKDSHFEIDFDKINSFKEGKFIIYSLGVVELPIRIILIRFVDESISQNLIETELWNFYEISELIDKSRPKLGRDEEYFKRSLISKFSNSNFMNSLRLSFYSVDMSNLGYNSFFIEYRSNHFELNPDFLINLLIGTSVYFIDGFPEEKQIDISEERKDLPIIHGVRLYPPLWIAPLPEITTEFLISNDFGSYKKTSGPFFFQFEDIEVRYCYDGFIICSEKDLNQAFRLLKLFSICAFINGFLVRSIKRDDILQGKRRFSAKRFTDTGIETIKVEKLTSDSMDSRRWDYYKDISIALPIKRVEIQDIFELALWMKNTPEIEILLDLLQRAYTFFKEEDYRSCILNTWSILEQIIEYIWDSILTLKRISSTMKKRMKQFPQWTVSSFLDALCLLDEFSSDLVAKIRQIKSERNSIMHEGSDTTKGYASEALMVSVELLNENINRRGITRLNLNKLREKLSMFLKD